MANQSVEQGHEVPDYENYDYRAEWVDRSIEDRAEKELILGMLGNHGDCLELGGGFGRVTSALEPHFHRTVMLDYSVSSLRIARARVGKATLVRSDIRTLPFKEDSFESALAIRVLHHVQDLRPLVGELVRVCRDGAEVLFGVPNPRLGLYGRVGRNQRVIIGRWDHRAYVHDLDDYSRPELDLVEIRGSGMLDNRVGRRLKHFPRLSKLDVVTSRAWFLKPELFLKYRVNKRTDA